MTENEAIEKGLIFTGISKDHIKETVKDKYYFEDKVSQIKHEFGGEAFVVNLNYGGKGIYVDQECNMRMQAKKCQDKLDYYIPMLKQKLEKQYREELAKLEKLESECKQVVEECVKQYPYNK